MAKRKFTNFVPRPKPRKRPRRHSKSLNKHIENMALNKVNIEFLRGQMDKVLTDIERLKDQNREFKYTNGNGQ